jgi:hypothetical protein
MYSIDFFLHTAHFVWRLAENQVRIQKPICRGNPGVYPDEIKDNCSIFRYFFSKNFYVDTDRKLNKSLFV